MVSVNDMLQGRKCFQTRPPVAAMKMNQGPPPTVEAEAEDKGKGKHPAKDTTTGARAMKTHRIETGREVLLLFAIQDQSQQEVSQRD